MDKNWRDLYCREEFDDEEVAGEEKLVGEDRFDGCGVVRAPQHAPAGREGEEGASYGVVGDAVPAEREEGRREGKRLLREILEGPPSAEKPRLDIRSLMVPLEEALAAQKVEAGGKSGGGGMLGGEAGGKTSGSAGSCVLEPCVMVIPGWVVTRKRGRAGKRSHNPDCESGEEADQVVAASSVAAMGIPTAVTAGDSKSYLCTTCSKSFNTFQALGGHALSHKNKKKKDVATASHEDGNGNGSRNESEAVVASSHGDANGNGNHHESETVVAASYLDANGVGDSNNKNAVVAASHEDANANGNAKERDTIKERKAVVASSEADANDNVNGGKISGNSNEKWSPIAPSAEDANENCNSDEEEAAVAASPKDANGNGQVGEMHHICKLCGDEYESGWALGGHMRKHWKRANGKPENEGSPERPAPVSASSQGPEAEGSFVGPALVAGVSQGHEVERSQEVPAPAAGGSQGPVLRLFGKNISM